MRIDSTAEFDWNGEEAFRVLTAVHGTGCLRRHDKRHDQRLFKGDWQFGLILTAIRGDCGGIGRIRMPVLDASSYLPIVSEKNPPGLLGH